MDTQKIIIFDAHEPSIVCALSYFLDQGYELKSSPPGNIENLWDNPDAWLFNVSHGISGDKKDFDFFLDFHPDKRISLQDLTDFGESPNLSPEAKDLLIGWKEQSNLRALAREIRDVTSWKYSRRAARYGQALVSSRTLNTHKIHENVMVEAAREIINQKQNFEITHLAEQYPSISRATENAMQKIFIQDSNFSIPSREVAYGYLDNISPLADFYAIRQEALRRFPYLAVIQFRENGQEFTWLGSKRLNIAQMFLLNEGSKNEALIKGKFKKINNYFRETISEIT